MKQFQGKRSRFVNMRSFIIGPMVFIGVLLAAAFQPFLNASAEGQAQLLSKPRAQTLPQNRLNTLAPRGQYIVVDTAQNRIYLKHGSRTIYTAVASTGSGARLQDPRQPTKGWVFDTPRGIFKITGKITNPVWFKPDWAFIEEGQPIPVQRKDRAESGVLGDYALGFGDGYFIHGTLYTRLLGTNVTHGCIRLGDQDLKYFYDHVSKGTTLFIF